MNLNGAEILVRSLIDQNVDTIFGYPGGSVLFIYDALYKYQDEITHYLTSHEQGASHAADGYARATGKVGVCLATSGPGATNLVTGIATAYMDSIPMVAITGNVATSLLGKDSFQEVDIYGVTMPITKHNFIVKDIKDLASTVQKAFHIAKDGRPGPVLIDITKDVTSNHFEYSPLAPLPLEKHTDKIDTESIALAIEMINESKKPIIYGGGGIIAADAMGELEKFVEKIDAPISLSTMGLGGFPASHSHFTGMIGMHGTKASNLAVTESDLLIAVGARFSDRVVSNINRFAPKAKIIHIDIDPAEINKNVMTAVSITGDLNEVLTKLNQKMTQLSHPEWMNRIHEMKQKYKTQYKSDGKLHPRFIFDKLKEHLQPDSIIATDVGQHQMWACQQLSYENPRTLVTSGGLGTMGFGLGAAIGAQIGQPDKRVVCITGDGCFRMNNIELATAVEYDVPVIVIIFNNHVLGMVRQWQKLFYGARYSHTNLPKATDFIKLTEAYGATAYNVNTEAELESALNEAFSMRRPTVINCEIDRDEKVFPMVPPGAGIDELVME